MIHAYDLEAKDFSIALPMLADKLAAIHELLLPEGKDLPKQATRGIAFILQEVSDDITVIDSALYEVDESANNFHSLGLGSRRRKGVTLAPCPWANRPGRK
jgi:hypothetical protein